MCGCMFMHGTMNHDEHQHSSQSTPVPGAGASPVSNGQKCGHCGYLLQSGFTFCPNCGMKLQESKCPACGQNVEAAWKTCAYCGSPLGESERQPLRA
jgi:RNA polymerase subunit RPABC4/transcription elongation factor Spt4